jgi:mRNA interferase YafQ
MLRIEYSNRMKHDVKLMKKRGKDLRKLIDVLALLASERPLPPVCRDHALSGKWKGTRECHIEPDWLLMYVLHEDVLVVTATATGSHADLFGI